MSSNLDVFEHLLRISSSLSSIDEKLEHSNYKLDQAHERLTLLENNAQIHNNRYNFLRGVLGTVTVLYGLLLARFTEIKDFIIK